MDLELLSRLANIYYYFYISFQLEKQINIQLWIFETVLALRARDDCPAIHLNTTPQYYSTHDSLI